jgi:hypothetical protein
MAKPENLDKALKRLVTSAHNGRRAKARLAARLAKMPVEQLRKIDPAVFVALGPNGMKLFAQARKTDPGLQPIGKAKPRPGKPSTLRRWRHRPWVMGLSVAVLCALAGAAVARSGALALDMGLYHPVQRYQDWPICHRLDLAADGCVYRTTSFNLTIEKIMALTGLDPETIVSANPHIDFHYRLDPNTILIVPGAVYY